MNILMVALADEDSEVRSNAAYATGMVVFYSSLDLSSYNFILNLVNIKLFYQNWLHYLAIKQC